MPDNVPDNDFLLSVPVRKYCLVLLAIVIGLITVHCSFNYYNHVFEEVPWLIQQLFDLDEENNIPTWFSGFLLLNNAFFLFLIAKAKQGQYVVHWKLLALGFLILSLDEVAGLHESFNTATDINWAIPGAVLVSVVGLIFVPFLLSLERRLAGLFVLAGTLYISGAIGVELLSEDMDEDEMAYGFATAVEEGMEMLGALMFLAVNLFEMKKGNRVNIAVSAG
ncbi:MAG: hypothetical protein ABGY96_12080 [bacterium]|nr:hypothetical protein [Gammaproteobacteria bacterium]HIL98393.1 hypothetical protein [Pseudomonadales bacterium]